MEPLAKRVLGWAALVALLHCASWTGYVTYLQQVSYADLEVRYGVIERMTFSMTSMSGSSNRARILELVVRPLNGPNAHQQWLSSGAPREKAAEYFSNHHKGQVVPIWVERSSGRVDDVLPPSPPDFVRLFLILLATVGLVTFIFVVGLLSYIWQPDTSSEKTFGRGGVRRHSRGRHR